MSRPKLLLFEPSLGLAPAIVREIFSIIQDLQHWRHYPLVEQNAHLCLQIADRGYVLAQVASPLDWLPRAPK